MMKGPTVAVVDGHNKQGTFKIVILTHNNQTEIGSILLHLLHFFRTEIGSDPDITVLDNNSSDRTLKLSTLKWIKVYRSRHTMLKTQIVKKALEIGKNEMRDTLIILDVTGGNSSDDVINLIRKSQSEGERFASAYIYPPKNGNSLGCWAIDRGLLGMAVERNFRVEDKLLELASKEELEMLAIKESTESRSKKKRTYILKAFPTSPLKVITILIRYHPLLFYGALGLLMILLALASGFYTVDRFYRTSELSYFPAFTTVLLVMVGGFLMVAGLMLNALNVLVEKLEAMKKWID